MSNTDYVDTFTAPEAYYTVKQIKERLYAGLPRSPKEVEFLKESAERLGFLIVEDRPKKYILWRVENKASPFMYKLDRSKDKAPDKYARAKQTLTEEPKL